jgi:hypothetical protein
MIEPSYKEIDGVYVYDEPFTLSFLDWIKLKGSTRAITINDNAPHGIITVVAFAKEAGINDDLYNYMLKMDKENKYIMYIPSNTKPREILTPA